MGRSTISLCILVSLLGLGLLAACQSDSDPLGPQKETEVPVGIGLLDSAISRVREIQTDAIILMTVARRQDYQMMAEPYESDYWTFICDDPANNNGNEAWFVSYDGTWDVDTVSWDISNIVYTDASEVEMDVGEAWERATAAGYDSPFQNWQLFQSTLPTIERPFFLFTSGEFGYVFVDAVTGVVWQEDITSAWR